MNRRSLLKSLLLAPVAGVAAWWAPKVWASTSVELALPVAKSRICFWVCRLCGGQFKFDTDKMTHSAFDIVGCIACEAKAGDEFPFTPRNGACPKCSRISDADVEKLATQLGERAGWTKSVIEAAQCDSAFDSLVCV